MNGGYTPTPCRRSRASLIEALRQRDGIACCYCGCQLDFGTYHTQPINAATLEHVVPRSAGGLNELGNLKLSCRKCNQARGRELQAANNWRNLTGYHALAIGGIGHA